MNSSLFIFQQTRKHFNLYLVLPLLITLFAPALDAANIPPMFSPADPAALFVQPGKKTVIVFSAKGIGKEASFPYSILDYTGQKISSGQLLRGEKGDFSAAIQFRRGFFEIMTPVSNQRFGVVSLEEYSGGRDPFFGIQTDFFIAQLKDRNKLYGVFSRLGISSVREYHPWPWVAKTSEEHWRKWDDWYLTAKDQHLKVLSYFLPQADFALNPEKFRSGENKPLFWNIDLNRMKPVLMQYLTRYGDSLLALQVGNEPDNMPVPGNEYAAFLDACSYILATSKLELKLVGSGFAGVSRPCQNSFFQNGMLNYIDVFAFQTYNNPSQLQDDIAEYRNQLKIWAPERAGMPIWITETSWPWDRGVLTASAWGGPVGKLRADIGEDMTSGCFLATTAAEAKACGIGAVFPFVVRFIPENNRNFGLMDFYWTAHRQLAAYLYSTAILSGKKYIGDLASGKREARQRVFSDGRETVVVFSRIETGNHCYNLSRLPVAGVFGADGRELRQDQSGSVTVPDGILYATLRPGTEIDHQLDRQTVAMRLTGEAESYRPVKRQASPVIYQSVLSGDTRKGTYGYLFDPKEIAINIYNLSETGQKTRPELLPPAGVKIIGIDPSNEELELPPDSRKTVIWKLDTANAPAQMRFTVRDQVKNGASPVVLDFTVSEKSQIVKTVPNDNAAEWQSNTSGKSTISYDETEQAIKVETLFPGDTKKSKWVYPIHRLRLSPEEVKKLIGVSFEMKAYCPDTPDNRHFTYVGGAVFDATNMSKFYYSRPLTSEWKTETIAINPIEHPVGEFRIRIGMTCYTTRLVFWFRNVKLYFDK